MLNSEGEGGGEGSGPPAIPHLCASQARLLLLARRGESSPPEVDFDARNTAASDAAWPGLLAAGCWLLGVCFPSLGPG